MPQDNVWDVSTEEINVPIPQAGDIDSLLSTVPLKWTNYDEYFVVYNSREGSNKYSKIRESPRDGTTEQIKAKTVYMRGEIGSTYIEPVIYFFNTKRFSPTTRQVIQYLLEKAIPTARAIFYDKHQEELEAEGQVFNFPANEICAYYHLYPRGFSPSHPLLKGKTMITNLRDRIGRIADGTHGRDHVWTDS